jgi:DNA-binding transcriptional ArsR family regulator
MALERQPRSPVDLERDLGLTYAEINWAVKELENAGLVELRADTHRSRQGRGADLVKVYGTTHTGWTRILRALKAVAATSETVD